ncbi:MAG: hypothetical protein U1C56_01065, partial [Candidatus Curtissbacteria bacterium]|nr:hypothetical protein [Candidatus Curtissbacteria bacterium]
NWQGGITDIQSQVRHSYEYKLWRKTIFERDNYTCQFCGQRGKKLHVDHWPRPFSYFLRKYNIQSLEDAINCEALWDIKNNRTLCDKCHRGTETYLNKSAYLYMGAN